MSEIVHDQILEAMLPQTGEWVTLHTWNCKELEVDAFDWLERWAERIGNGQAPLPGGGRANLAVFAAIRSAQH